MRATEIAFPVAHKMLCRWHICKNVMAKHWTGFTEEDWQMFMTLFSGVMRAGTEDELQEKLVQIQTEWTPIRCCYCRTCHKPPANIINASGTKRL
ncbi:unnamed protein product [Sphagnum balticum]